MPRANSKTPKWVADALRLGFKRFAAGDHEPFVLLDADGKEHLLNLESINGRIDESLVDAGREIICGFVDTGRSYALVWDGYLTDDEGRSDAVFAEVGKRGQAGAIIYAQKYEPGEAPNSLVRVGTEIIAAEVEHLWKSPAPTESSFTSVSVFTILHSRKLADAEKAGRLTFKEERRWVSAKKLLEQAQRIGQSVPIIFAPAEKIWNLTHWGLLESVKLKENKDGRWLSVVNVNGFAKTKKPHANKTQLVISSTRTNLSKNHIRPYVLVDTPSFLSKPAKKR